MKKISIINWRFILVCSFFSLSIFAIAYKIISLQIDDSIFLKNEGKKKYIKYRNINPVRGTIYDRNNFPLAVSIINYDLYALKGLELAKFISIKDLISLDEDLNINESFSKKTLIKKGLSRNEQLIIETLKNNKLEVEVRHSRHYPLGDQIAPLVGFYGKDRAQEGLEKSYDSVLSGKNGKEKFYKNAKQKIISKPIEVDKAIQGRDIVLTIDSTIQFYAYKFLAEAIKENKAKAGTALVFDNMSGEVLAVASYPSYNPNDPSRVIQKNRALIDAYELGSVLKPILLSSAIDNNIFDPDIPIEIPRRLKINDKIISDYKSYEELTPKQVIAYSSQVGASKIAIMLGYEKLKDAYYNFGFGKPISINFPSSAFGLMNIKDKISDKELVSWVMVTA